MVKWHFIVKNVVLCRKECGTLSAKMWRFNEQSGVFRLFPSFWGVKSSVTLIRKGIGGMRGMRLIPLITPTYPPPFWARSLSFDFLHKSLAVKRIAKLFFFFLCRLGNSLYLCGVNMCYY